MGTNPEHNSVSMSESEYAEWAVWYLARVDAKFTVKLEELIRVKYCEIF